MNIKSPIPKLRDPTRKLRLHAVCGRTLRSAGWSRRSGLAAVRGASLEQLHLLRLWLPQTYRPRLPPNTPKPPEINRLLLNQVRSVWCGLSVYLWEDAQKPPPIVPMRRSRFHPGSIRAAGRSGDGWFLLRAGKPEELIHHKYLRITGPGLSESWIFISGLPPSVS